MSSNQQKGSQRNYREHENCIRKQPKSGFFLEVRKGLGKKNRIGILRVFEFFFRRKKCLRFRRDRIFGCRNWGHCAEGLIWRTRRAIYFDRNRVFWNRYRFASLESFYDALNRASTQWINGEDIPAQFREKGLGSDSAASGSLFLARVIASHRVIPIDQVSAAFVATPPINSGAS